MIRPHSYPPLELPKNVIKADGSIRWMEEKPARKPQVVICDLDGTIADASHRMKYILQPDGSKRSDPDWNAFFDACDQDAPIENVIKLVRGLHALKYRLAFVSGRSDRVFNKTVMWLSEHGFDGKYEHLGMRNHGDHRPDYQVKLELLSQLMVKMVVSHDDIFCALDDRDQVVQMWRKQGILCLQVADGAF